MSDVEEPPAKRMKMQHRVEDMHQMGQQQPLHEEFHEPPPQQPEEEDITNADVASDIVQDDGVEDAYAEPSVPLQEHEDEQQLQEQQQRVMETVTGALQDGFTYKTLQTMQFLGSQEERVLSFSELTNEQSCKVAAGLFYELLVIRSKGMVELDQPEPYGDTKISKCEQFDQFLNM